ncbi:glycosyltransferase sypH [Vibrio ishigakensis]|uniref:Glycosyltransferase sypH n=1 Tax=Vibrio ishigakensis TaxID=1481914 RepID=A0A0B8NZR6_9VIBR|nr:glycosyltransferase sypH [Vibrio ishigakensis]
MSSVYPRLDLLLITSRYEGLPMTALEAMARGVPVASLDVGDISKLVKHNQNGFVVSDVEALATVSQTGSLFQIAKSKRYRRQLEILLRKNTR